ncbi:MAG: hypothetical protein WC295_01525 [Methanoregula sp.]|jgi:hypothetical protein
MPIVLKTPEGKKVVIDISHDDCLYESPHNPPNTGTRYTSGTDLYAHKARSGAMYFYSYSWSMWQGTEAEYSLMTEAEMRSALVDHASDGGWGAITDNERTGIEQYFPGLFDENA